MSTRNWIWAGIFIFLFLLPFEKSFSGEDPGIPDTVRLGRFTTHLDGPPPCHTTAILPLLVFNDEYLYQMNILLKWTGPLVGDSGRVVGERGQYIMEYFQFSNYYKLAIVALGTEWQPPAIPPGEGVIAYLYFSVQDTGFVTVDSVTHITPGGWSFQFADTLYNWFVPHFAELQTDILQCYPGDINQDEDVDIGDVIFLVSSLFLSGPSPPFMTCGDLNKDCAVNIADVVYLVTYLFQGGPPPQAGCLSEETITKKFIKNR